MRHLQSSKMAFVSRRMRRLLGLVRRGRSRLSRSNNTGLASSWLRRSSFSSSASSSWEFNDMDASDDDEPCSFLADVPEGCLAVYVGSDRQRFVIGTRFLSNPLFRVLLDRAAEEYGFEHAGALTIPCEAVLFEHICWLLGNDDPAAAELEIDELLSFYSS